MYIKNDFESINHTERNTLFLTICNNARLLSLSQTVTEEGEAVNKRPIAPCRKQI